MRFAGVSAPPLGMLTEAQIVLGKGWRHRRLVGAAPILDIARSAYTAARLYLLRRRQFDNLTLRRQFRDRYGIDVGLYSYGCFDRWRMPGPMQVGRYCSIASTTRSTRANHPTKALTTHPIIYERAFGAVDQPGLTGALLVIEDDVWIGHHTFITPSCRRVGRGAVIGAGSVVTRDVEAYAVVAGNPARKLRDRFPADLREAIDASRWWELDFPALTALIREHPDLVYDPTPQALAAHDFGSRRP